MTKILLIMYICFTMASMSQEDFDMWAIRFQNPPGLLKWAFGGKPKVVSSENELRSVLPDDMPLDFVKGIEIGDHEGYYLFRAPSKNSEKVKVWLMAQGHLITWFEKQEKRKRLIRAVPLILPKDPKYPEQWHFWPSNTSSRPSIGASVAWEGGFTGKGIGVAIVDDGVDTAHFDIVDSFEPSLSWDFIDNTNIITPPMTSHGTRCAGQIFARANDKFGVGVAFEASLSVLKLIGDYTYDAMEASALVFKYQHIDIYSMSWGPADDGQTLEGPGYLTNLALKDGVTYGRNGRGNIYVLASGNGGWKDSCGADGYATSIYTISIGAVDESLNWPSYSELCSAQLVTSFGGNFSVGIATTDLVANGQWTTGHFGTSAATPFVSGILALLLNKRPNLSWRDVQHLLVKSALQVNMNDAEWSLNGAGLAFSEKYGFGLLLADRLLKQVDNHTSVPQSINIVTESFVAQKIPLGISEVEIDLQGIVGTKDGPPKYLEHVELAVNIKHPRRGDLKISVQSPSNTESVLLGARRFDDRPDLKWTLMSVRFWNEPSIGTWRVKIENVGASVGSLESYSLTLHGIACDSSSWKVDMDTGLTKCSWEIEQAAAKQRSVMIIALSVSIIVSLLILAAITWVYMRRKSQTIQEKREGISSKSVFRPFPRSISLESNRLAALARDDDETTTADNLELLPRANSQPILVEGPPQDQVIEKISKPESPSQSPSLSRKLTISTVSQSSPLVDGSQLASPQTIDVLASPIYTRAPLRASPLALNTMLEGEKRRKLLEEQLDSPKSPKSKARFMFTKAAALRASLKRT